MDWKTKETIQAIFEGTGIKVEDASQWLEIYYACRILIGLKRRQETYSSQIATPTFTFLFDSYGFSFPDLFRENPNGFCAKIDSLCHLLKDNSLDDTDTFLSEFLPFVVQKQHEYFALFSARKSRIPELVTLIVLLKFSQKLSPQVRTVLEIDDIYRYFCDSYSTELIDNLSLNRAQFANAWSAAFPCSVQNIPVRTNGNINDAIERYKKEKVPLSHLLQDVHDLKMHRRDLEKALNPWRHLNRKIKKLPVESGCTIEETLFEQAAFLLKNEQPTDLIRSIFYPPSRNDSGLECNFVFEKFADQIKFCNSVLIINPSPDIILKWSEDARFQNKTTSFVCADLTVAHLYHLQFPTAEFFTFDNFLGLNQVDSVLILGRDLDENDLFTALSSLQIVSDKSRVLALLSSRIVDNSHFGFRDILKKVNCKIEHILLLPTVAANSSPRKKSLFYIKKDEQDYDCASPIALYESNCNHEKYLYVQQFYTAIPRQLFNEGKHTLKQLLKQVSAETGITKEKRDSAKPYYFSKEIVLYYTIQENKKKSFAGKAYYCETTHANSRTRGRRLTDMIEKGLRAKTRDGVFKKLELIPFDSRVEGKIIDDITRTYGDSKSSLSLKTVWFCCRPLLLKNAAYDDDMAMRLFCGKSQGLGELIPEFSSEYVYEEKMGNIFSEEQGNIPLKSWNQLNLILKVAIREGYFHYNPIPGMLPYLSNQASQEQREVRNALTKKSFTHEEELRILNYITAPANEMIGPRKALRYETDSLILAGAIRFFTGMSAREVCALEWKDFLKISGTDSYQLIVSKFISDAGTILSHTDQEDWKKFRKIPIPATLAIMLQRRFQFLLVHGGNEQSLSDFPIVQKNTATASHGKNNHPYCRPKDINHICKVLIEQANIPQQMLLLPGLQAPKETDIYKYQGDIFQSNYKYHANHVCGLTKGELSYILGNTPPDTFSKHYCDYTNDMVQYAISVKLQRWASTLDGFQGQPNPHQYTSGSLQKKYRISAVSSHGKVACVDIILKSDQASVLDVSVENEFGCSGNYTIYKEGGHNH